MPKKKKEHTLKEECSDLNLSLAIQQLLGP